MGWVIVIEENPSILSELQESLTAIDSKIGVIPFPDSTSFLNWMQQVQDHDPKINPQVPSDKFLGIITAIETWRFRDLKLIGKFKALFIQKKFAQSEDEIFVVFTGYETPDFQKKRFEYRSVNNFLFKPFDKVVLKQMLSIALGGRAPVKSHETHVLKTQSQIEMLKEVSLTGIDELGFQTTSDRPLQAGSIAKYYADFLETKQHRSALAQILSSNLEAGKTLSDVRLRFFALDHEQSFALQRLAQAGKKRPLPTVASQSQAEYEFYFIKNEASSLSQEVQPSIERFFDHSVSAFKDLNEANQEISKFGSTDALKARFVFLDGNYLSGNEVEEAKRFLTLHETKKIVLFILSPHILPEKVELELSEIVSDIFYLPFNRSYIAKGLKQRYPDLKTKEDLYENFTETEKTIHSAIPVTLVEVSESGLVLKYHREIALGKFREFVFWLPNEIEVPNVLAQCNFTQMSEDKKSWLCHFVFFGLHDHEQKFIRRWMLAQYVDEKQKADS